MSTTTETIESAAAELGLSMTTVFVPWSRSRFAGEKNPSLNWKVTILKDGRPVLTTDYTAGCGHCPGYKQRDYYRRDDLLRWECEHGRTGRLSPDGDAIFPSYRNEPILPKFADVLASIVTDADAIDYRDFGEWAANMGYDADSRKAEVVYRACLDFGLKLRAGLGDDGLKKLRKACEEY